jgi:hypothetical protein
MPICRVSMNHESNISMSHFKALAGLTWFVHDHSTIELYNGTTQKPTISKSRFYKMTSKWEYPWPQVSRQVVPTSALPRTHWNWREADVGLLYVWLDTGGWSGNWIYWTLIIVATSNYNALTNSRNPLLTTAHSKSSLFATPSLVVTWQRTATMSSSALVLAALLACYHLTAKSLLQLSTLNSWWQWSTLLEKQCNIYATSYKLSRILSNI